MEKRPASTQKRGERGRERVEEREDIQQTTHTHTENRKREGQRGREREHTHTRRRERERNESEDTAGRLTHPNCTPAKQIVTKKSLLLGTLRGRVSSRIRRGAPPPSSACIESDQLHFSTPIRSVNSNFDFCGSRSLISRFALSNCWHFSSKFYLALAVGGVESKLIRVFFTAETQFFRFKPKKNRQTQRGSQTQNSHLFHTNVYE